MKISPRARARTRPAASNAGQQAVHNALQENDRVVEVLHSSENVLEMLDWTIRRFWQITTAYNRTPEPRKSIAYRLDGACRHLRDEIRSAPLRAVPSIPAYVHSDTPFARLCAHCSDRAVWVDEKTCTTCNLPNTLNKPLNQQKRSEYACRIYKFHDLRWSALTFVMPLCDSCRDTISEYLKARSEGTEVA
jgi:hypothetical protein